MSQNSLAEENYTKEMAKEVGRGGADRLRMIYIVTIGLAIAQAITQAFTGQPGLFGTHFAEGAYPTQLLVLFAALATGIRFAHGCPIRSLAALTQAHKWQWVSSVAAFLEKSVAATRFVLRLLLSFRGRLNRVPLQRCGRCRRLSDNRQ